MAREEPAGTPRREPIDRRGPRGLVDRAEDGPICLRADQVPDEDRRAAAAVGRDRVGDVVGSHARGRDHLQPDVAIGDVVAIGQLADRVREWPPAAGTGVDRYVQPEGEALGAARVVRIDMGQRDRDDLAARRGRRVEDGRRRLVRRVAGVDEHESPPPDEVRVHGLAGHAARARDHDTGDPRPLSDDAGRGHGARHDPLPDFREPRHVLELLERRARRDPHREVTRGHRIERGTRRLPAMADDLVRLERRLGAVRQLGSEEPRVEPAGHDRRRRPVADRGEEIRSQPEIKRLGHVLERRAAAQQGLARGRGRGRVERRLGQQHASLLEQLPQRGEVAGQRVARRQVAAERGPGIVSGDDGSRREPRVQVRGVDGAPRKDVHVGGERHRRRPAGQEDFGAAGRRAGAGRPSRPAGE